jgi:hypothetical protein
VKLTPEQLREAYARGTSTGTGEHPAPEALSRLLQGTTSAEERQRVVDHVAACARCAEELRVARPVGDRLSKVGGAVIRPAAWWPRAVLLAAAASVLVAGGLALRVGRTSGPAGETYRAAEAPGVQSLIPEGARVRREALTLRWRGAPAGATFEVLVATERLDEVVRLKGLRSSEATVPAAALAGVPSGARLVWQVTIVFPDGSRSASSSFVVTLE